MAKTNKVYNKQYKDIKEVQAKIMQTDINHKNLQGAQLTLDVRIPIRNRKITLNDVVDMMLDGFNKINNRLDNLETRMTNVENNVLDLKVRVTNIENRLDKLEENDKKIFDILERNNLY